MLHQHTLQQQWVKPTGYQPACAWPRLAVPELVSNLFRLTLWIKSEGAGENIAEQSTPLLYPGSLAPTVKPISRSAVSRPEQTHHTIHKTVTFTEQAEICVLLTQFCVPLETFIFSALLLYCSDPGKGTYKDGHIPLGIFGNTQKACEGQPEITAAQILLHFSASITRLRDQTHESWVAPCLKMMKELCTLIRFRASAKEVKDTKLIITHNYESFTPAGVMSQHWRSASSGGSSKITGSFLGCSVPWN